MCLYDFLWHMFSFLSQRNKRCFGISWVSSAYKYNIFVRNNYLYIVLRHLYSKFHISRVHTFRDLRIPIFYIFYVLLCIYICVCACECLPVCCKCGQIAAIIIEQIVSGASEATGGSCENNATLSRWVSQVAKSPSRNSQDADKVRGQARAGQARRWLTGDHLTIRALFIPRTHLASSVVDYVEKRAKSGKAQEASLAWWLDLVRAGVGLTSDLFLGTKYYNDQRCEPDKPETVGHTVEESSKMWAPR